MNKLLLIVVITCLSIPAHAALTAIDTSQLTQTSIYMILGLISAVGGVMILLEKRNQADLQRGDNLWARAVRDNQK